MESWDFPGCGIALLTGEQNNVIVVDCDSTESWMAWEAKMPLTPFRVKTRRGMHYYYRHPGTYVKSGSHLRIDGLDIEYDVKGDRSYVQFVGTIHKGFQYTPWPTKDNPQGTWVKPEKLPVFDVAWRPEKAKKDVWDSDEVRDIVAYISKIDAVEGQGGDKATYRVCSLLKESGISLAEAMAIIADWNTSHCTPPWTARDLFRKLERVYGDG